ncbi:hypothetical protein B4U84_04580 [Westiellopsis prolifica IICB1]|nr:hypothetical protein B4U84_04580 [Westiellopsis prolifica IICB1]
MGILQRRRFANGDWGFSRGDASRTGIGDSPEETLRVDASAASHRVRGLGRQGRKAFEVLYLYKEQDS